MPIIRSLDMHADSSGSDLSRGRRQRKCHSTERGLSYSLNTDDPGAFDCSMESEYETVAKAFGFDPADFMGVFRQSLAARFEPRLRYLASVSAPT